MVTATCQNLLCRCNYGLIYSVVGYITVVNWCNFGADIIGIMGQKYRLQLQVSISNKKV